MQAEGRTYIAIDLKSFYASVECVERGLDPLLTNLVVADGARTEKTICLAVSPALKSFGVPGRPRLFEVVQKAAEINARRRFHAPGGAFAGESQNLTELREHPELALSYITAKPRMAYYLEYSARIYQIYLRYVAPEDIHVYSIDEVFIDATQYLKLYGLSAHDFTRKLLREILQQTGMTATAGIGTNLYLCKIAMDIVAKHEPADRDGVRIAALDERSYRKKLWRHRPLTDFWRIGRGYAKKLEAAGLRTMEDIARCSMGGENEFYNEALLYKMFGINAELLIDHAWGIEPCTISDIKAYRPENSSLVSGQVLQEPYAFEKAGLVLREMADELALDLVRKGLAADQLALTVGYDVQNLEEPERRRCYHGEIKTDHYGRQVPKPAHGSIRLGRFLSSGSVFADKTMELYRRITDPTLLIRRMSLTANHVKAAEQTGAEAEVCEQLSLFGISGADGAEDGIVKETKSAEEKQLEKEHRMQEAVLRIKEKYGKNALLRGRDLQDGATGIQRNRQIGGHHA